jgi:hypothetical protein
MNYGYSLVGASGVGMHVFIYKIPFTDFGLILIDLTRLGCKPERGHARRLFCPIPVHGYLFLVISEHAVFFFVYGLTSTSYPC